MSIYDFDDLKPVTMTIIVPYSVDELNLPGLFALLPVTDQCLPVGVPLQKKQGKIKLPIELNKPGEILSMRYKKEVRGIVRSEVTKSFPHSIIIDIGTSVKILSIKLSRTIEVTGSTSFALATEVVDSIFEHIKKCQSDQTYLQDNLEVAGRVKYKFLHSISGGEVNIDDETETKIWDIYAQRTKGYPIDKISQFIDFMLSFNRNLYSGSLKVEGMFSDMVNNLFNLGYPINQVSFARVMDSPPFVCKFNNAKSTAYVSVLFFYNKIDKTTGQTKIRKHTFTVNKSGHIRHSGPSSEAMKPVYYAFMQRVLQNYTKIRSIEKNKPRCVTPTRSRSISTEEWKTLLENEEILRQQVIEGKMSMIFSPTQELNEEEEINEIIHDDVITEIIDPILQISTPKAKNYPSLTFDYKPLLIVG